MMCKRIKTLNNMLSAKAGDTVTIHYEGRLADGAVFDSSRHRSPLSFQIGAQQVIVGFDKAVQGMVIGEQQTITILPAEGYGDRRTELIFRVNRQQVPTNLPLEVGSQIKLPTAEGKSIPVMVIELDGDKLTLDGNHPLAGETLTFEIELIAIEEPY